MAMDIDDEWRKLLLERIDDVKKSIDSHLERDELFYEQVAELKLGATMIGRVVKFGAAVVGALGVERIYNLFKH